MHPSLTNSHPCVGDCLSTVLVAQSPKVEKGHEASLWSLKLQGGIDYFVVPTTSKRGQRCKFIILYYIILLCYYYIILYYTIILYY